MHGCLVSRETQAAGGLVSAGGLEVPWGLSHWLIGRGKEQKLAAGSGVLVSKGESAEAGPGELWGSREDLGQSPEW